jgi:hypothetical protein
MVEGNVDPIFGGADDDRAVLVGSIRLRYAVRRIIDIHEDVVAEGRIAQRRRPRRNDQAMGMNIGRIQRQIDPI